MNIMNKEQIKKVITYLSENKHLKNNNLNKEFLSNVIFEHFEEIELQKKIKYNREHPTAIWRPPNEKGCTTYHINEFWQKEV